MNLKKYVLLPSGGVIENNKYIKGTYGVDSKHTNMASIGGVRIKQSSILEKQLSKGKSEVRYDMII